MRNPANPGAAAPSSLSSFSRERTRSFAALGAANWTSLFLMPREHGAWGMVSLPFIVAAWMAGGWPNLRMVAGAFAVISIFLLRAPLLVLWRGRAKGFRVEAQGRLELLKARFSLMVYGLVGAVAGIYMLITLPVVPILLLGGGALLLTAVTLFLEARNYRRYPALQIASAIGLTASALPAYLAARGHLDGLPFWIWALCAAHSTASVLFVHALLESVVASRKPVPRPSVLPHRRNALLAQVGLWLLLGALAVQGKPWLILPFLPPSLLQWWELWQMGSGARRRVSMQRVGLVQLGASMAFFFLLGMVLR